MLRDQAGQGCPAWSSDNAAPSFRAVSSLGSRVGIYSADCLQQPAVDSRDDGVCFLAPPSLEPEMGDGRIQEGEKDGYGGEGQFHPGLPVALRRAGPLRSPGPAAAREGAVVAVLRGGEDWSGRGESNP